MDLHVVIKGQLHDLGELPPILQNLPESAVIQHARGLKRTENPHYHCWVPGVQHDTFKAAMRSFYEEKLPDLKWKTHGNAYWTVKVFSTGFDDWLKYVINPKEVKAPTWIQWNRTGNPPEVPTEMPVLDIPVVQPVTLPQVVTVAKKSSYDKQLKFLKYCQDNIHGDPNEETAHSITRLLFEYCKFNGHTTESCCFTYVNFVLSHIHKGAKYEATRNAFADRIITRFFSNY